MARFIGKISLATLVVAGTLTGMQIAPAQAQFFRNDDGYGPAQPYYGRGYDRYDDDRSGWALRPRQILRIVMQQGYQPVGPMFRNGGVFVVDVIDPQGVQRRLMVDAYQGDILQTHGVARPVPPDDIPNVPHGPRPPETTELDPVPVPPQPAAPTPEPHGPTTANKPDHSALLQLSSEPKPRLTEKQEVAKSVLSPAAPLRPPVKPRAAPKAVPVKEAPGASVTSKAPPADLAPKSAPVTPPAPTPVAVTTPEPAPIERPAPPVKAVEAPSTPAPVAAAPAPITAQTPSPTPMSHPAAPKAEPDQKPVGSPGDVPVAPLD
jgi:hypothetical protein